MPSLDDEAIEVLKNKIRTEDEANRLRQRELLAAERKERLFYTYLDETTKLRQEVKTMIEYYQKHALMDDAISDMFANISERMDRLERIAILQLGMRANQDEAGRTRAELREELELRHTKKLLDQYYRTLRKLEEREAEFGDRAPVDLCNQIEDVKEKIARLEEKLGE